MRSIWPKVLFSLCDIAKEPSIIQLILVPWRVRFWICAWNSYWAIWCVTFQPICTCKFKKIYIISARGTPRCLAGRSWAWFRGSFVSRRSVEFDWIIHGGLCGMVSTGPMGWVIGVLNSLFLSALVCLLKFVVAQESHLLSANVDIFALIQKVCLSDFRGMMLWSLLRFQVLVILNLFITYGDTFLPNPVSYDELYYEVRGWYGRRSFLHPKALSLLDNPKRRRLWKPVFSA